MFLVDEMGFLLSLFFSLVGSLVTVSEKSWSSTVRWWVLELFIPGACARGTIRRRKREALFSLSSGKQRVEAGIVEEAFLKAINCFLNAGSFFFSS